MVASPEYNGYDLQVGIQREFEMLRLGDLGETSFFGGYKNSAVCLLMAF
jgi:hypothetical protein